MPAAMSTETTMTPPLSLFTFILWSLPHVRPLDEPDATPVYPAGLPCSQGHGAMVRPSLLHSDSAAADRWSAKQRW